MGSADLSRERHGIAFAPSDGGETLPHRSDTVMDDKPLILIVDDEAELARTVSYAFEQEGFATRHADTGRAALELALASPLPDLILLDMMLPDLSGTEVCRELRRSEAARATPIVFLTARDNEIDRVVAFELGADDYVSKPFSVRELVLRVRALLRRARSSKTLVAAPDLGAGERLRIDPDGHQVWVDGAEVGLTALEFRLLATLLSRRGRVQTRSQLLEDVWGVHADVTTRTVDTHVKRLREKLGEAGSYVETIRGVGYRFRARHGA
jgi:two-component system, OmpR family, phosphate regulon response regulator PhoB